VLSQLRDLICCKGVTPLDDDLARLGHPLTDRSQGFEKVDAVVVVLHAHHPESVLVARQVVSVAASDPAHEDVAEVVPDVVPCPEHGDELLPDVLGRDECLLEEVTELTLELTVGAHHRIEDVQLLSDLLLHVDTVRNEARERGAPAVGDLDHSSLVLAAYESCLTHF